MHTGKYNMSILKEIAQVEVEALHELVVMYKVEDEDELPIEFDIHELMDLDKVDRRPCLEKALESCPGNGRQEFIDKVLERIAVLNPRIS
ncbi:unnamed protein product [Choristocarpus tenellus]